MFELESDISLSNEEGVELDSIASAEEIDTYHGRLYIPDIREAPRDVRIRNRGRQLTVGKLYNELCKRGLDRGKHPLEEFCVMNGQSDGKGNLHAVDKNARPPANDRNGEKGYLNIPTELGAINGDSF